MSTATATIKFLVEPTRMEWVDQALANFDTILLDHAQCERKAAGVALSLINRYPSDRDLITALTEIAQEELAHFAKTDQTRWKHTKTSQKCCKSSH